MGKAWYLEVGGEWTPPSQKVDPKHPDSKPRPVHWLPIVLSRKEVRRLLAAPDCTDLERLVLRTLYASGMRVEELVALKRPALDGKTSTIRLADRQVVVDRKTMRQLLALDWKAWRWSVDSVTKLVVKAGKDCQVLERYLAVGRTLLPKALRNAYGAHSMENGMGIYNLHGLLGHTYLDTTEFIFDLAVNRFRASYDASHPLVIGSVKAKSGRAELHRLVEAANRAQPDSDNETDEDWAEDWDDEDLRGGDKPADLKESEVQAVLDVAGAEDPVDRLVLLVIYAGGLRIGDVVKLRFADIDYDEAKLFVRQSKEHKDRYCLIDRNTAKLLRSWQNGRPLEGRVFPGCSKTIARKVTDVASKAGVLQKYQAMSQTVSPHTFRHAYATHLYRHGMDLYGLEKMLGHTDLEATQIYVTCNLADWRRAYAKSGILK